MVAHGRESVSAQCLARTLLADFFRILLVKRTGARAVNLWFGRSVC
ncbi:MAG: hypothetical protein OJF47_000012 [Nitrospira sp.]|jgi:hypothetical protein|nr:MAG: hypothetical protein OJF47_000012 [Nitrospira sp.]